MRDLRRQKGVFSTQRLAKLMKGRYSYSNISRRETGALKIDFAYLKSFCEALRFDKDEETMLMAMARVSQLHPKDSMKDAVSEWAKISVNARSYQYYCTSWVCYYLQTHDYMHTIVSQWQDIFEDAERSTSLRLDDASKTLKDPSKRFRFLFHENVLYFSVGSPPIMIDQLIKLQQFIDEPNVELRILPKSVFASSALQEFYIIDDTFCFCENRLDFSITDDTAAVRRFKSDFDLLWSRALIGVRRNEIIKEAIDYYKKLDSRLTRAGARR